MIRRVPTQVWVILAVAFALRLATVALTWHTPLDFDPSDFSRTAASIAAGHGYPLSNRAPGGGPSAFRPPGYPVVLAGVYAVAGHPTPGLARMVGALLGTVSVALIGLIALRLWCRRVAMFALGIAAVAPPLVVLSTALISEALFVPVMLGAVLAALHGQRSARRHGWAVVAGVLVGAATLTRTNGVILALPVALAFVPARSWRRFAAWTPSVVVILAVVLTVAPWTFRNWTVFHAFVPVSDEAGYTLAGTYNETSRADNRLPAVWIEAEHGASPEYARILSQARAARWNEVTYGSHLEAAAIADIERDPVYVLKVGYWNAIRMFNLGEVRFARMNLHDTGVPLAPALALVNTAPLLLALALGGVLTRAARRAPKWVWLVPLCLATSIFVTGFVRFRAPIDPFLVLLAALALADVSKPIALRWGHKGPAAAGTPSPPAKP